MKTSFQRRLLQLVLLTLMVPAFVPATSVAAESSFTVNKSKGTVSNPPPPPPPPPPRPRPNAVLAVRG